MYKTLLSDYDTRQRDLVLENAELWKVLQQMKRDIVSILTLRKPVLKDHQHENDGMQVCFTCFSSVPVRMPVYLFIYIFRLNWTVMMAIHGIKY